MSDTITGAELENAVRFILEKSARETLSGSYIINADDFPADILSPESFSSNISAIADMLYDYGAVADADITPDGAIDLNLYLAYCPNYERLPGEEDEFPDDREIFDPLLTKREDAVEQPVLNESEQNFAAWLTVTESSRFRWVEDEIYRLNGRGAMYYTGGEDGVYMRIGQDGKLEAGRYEGAIPHIGEAFFKPVVTKQFDSFSDAFQAAMEAGGKQFMVDMFSGPDRQPLTHIVSQKEKPSVLEQLRNAKSDHPCAPKVQGRHKHLRGDYGRNGQEFHHTWFEHDSGRKTPEFQSEFQTVMDTLRQGVLKDLKSARDYCHKHPEARLPGDMDRYGFKVETESRQFFVRCTTLSNDYFYVFAYDKAPALEQEKPSVVRQLRAAQNAPKPPRKAKSPDKSKDGAER